VLAVTVALPGLALADDKAGSVAGAWTYEGSLCLFRRPSAATTFPAGGSGVNVDGANILESLNFVHGGAFDVHKGPWGVWNDLLYVNLGASKAASRDFTIGNIGLPAGTSANLNFDIKAWVWTSRQSTGCVDEPVLRVRSARRHALL
jgi:hypothetical protein